MAKKDDDLHAEGLKIYGIAIERDSENRERYEDDTRFARLSEQWPDNIRKQREQDGRPCLTINKLPAFIRQVVNDARQNTPQIKFHAVGDGADQWTAKVLDGLVRNIEVTSNADVAYDTAIENAVTGNVGYWRVTTEYAGDDSFDQDIRIEPIPNSLSVVPDPHCMDADSANWNDAFVTETYSLDSFKAKWPRAEVASFEGDKRDCPADWLDGDDVMVAEWWKRREVEKVLIKLSNGEVMYEDQLKDPDLAQLLAVNGITEAGRRTVRAMKVTQHIMNGVEIIETNEWAGKYIPIVPVYGDQIIIDGKRHLKSMIHDAKDAQRSFNYWRTTTTEVAALAPRAPWVGPVGSFASDPNWQTANTANHAFLEFDPVEGGPPQRVFASGPDAAAMQEAMSASDDMKSVMGLYDASLGAKSNETSGRAILARQREGDVSTFNFTDNQNRGIRHTGRILADLIPKTYTVERIIRVIHEDGSNENIKVNAPTQPMQAQQQAAQGQQQQTPEQIGMEHIYDLTSGKYDVTCEAGPSYTTQREEAAAQMMNFIQAYPPAAQVIGPMLAKNLDWPGAEEISQALKALLPPQLQGQNPQLQQAQQEMQQLHQQLLQAQQHAQAVDQDKSLEERKVEIDAFKASTDRIKALGLTVTPEAAAALGMQTAQSAVQALSSPGSPESAPSQPAQPAMPMNQQPQPPAMPQPMPGPAQPPEGVA
jgi:hypothetical protein